MRSRRTRSPGRVTVMAALFALVIAACGTETDPPVADPIEDEPPQASEPTDDDEEEGISAERCAANEAVGTIRFATGFFWAAASSITEVVVAKDRGYFEELCLDVEVESGIGTQNFPKLVAGEIHATSASGVGFTAQMVDQGLPVTGVAVLGRSSIWALMTDPDVTALTDLEGGTIGLKGHYPPEIEMLLGESGVNRGQLNEVQVSYDPRIITQSDLNAIPVYKSNEVYQIEQAGIDVNYFDPDDLGVFSTFAVIVMHNDFVAANPTAVEDFLRAMVRAFYWSVDNPEDAVQYLADRAEADAVDYDYDLELFRWKTESGLVLAETTASAPVGTPLYDMFQAILDDYVAFDLVEDGHDVRALFPEAYISAIYDSNGELNLWP